MGATVPAGQARLRAECPAGVELVLLRNGRPVARQPGLIDVEPPEPGAFRVEAYLPGHEVPWIVSNHIYVRDPSTPATPPEAAPDPAIAAATRLSDGVLTPLAAEAWVRESDPSSTAAIARGEAETTLTFVLGGGAPAHQYASMAAPLPAGRNASALEIEASSSRPMRVSVQVRTLGTGDERWGRSIYLDTTPRRIAIPLDDMTPFVPSIGPDRNRALDSVLIVVDTLNTLPGTGGEVRVRRAAVRTAAGR
jgi:hypothetical protein